MQFAVNGILNEMSTLINERIPIDVLVLEINKAFHCFLQ